MDSKEESKWIFIHPILIILLLIIAILFFLQPPPPPVTFTINAQSSAGGKVSPSGEINVEKNHDQTFTFEPEQGHYISKILVDGSPVNPDTSYEFTNIEADHTIEARFELIEYNLNVDVNFHNRGSVEIYPDSNPYHYGEQVQLTAVTAPGWEFKSWSDSFEGESREIRIVDDAVLTANFGYITRPLFPTHPLQTIPCDAENQPLIYLQENHIYLVQSAWMGDLETALLAEGKPLAIIVKIRPDYETPPTKIEIKFQEKTYYIPIENYGEENILFTLSKTINENGIQEPILPFYSEDMEYYIPEVNGKIIFENGNDIQLYPKKYQVTSFPFQKIFYYYASRTLNGQDIDYGSLQENEYLDMLENANKFINATYPCKLKSTNNYESAKISGAKRDITHENGMQLDALEAIPEAQLAANGAAYGIVIGPYADDNNYYFRYHSNIDGKGGIAWAETWAGLSWGPQVKGAIASENCYTAVSHELGHMYGLYPRGFQEQYQEVNHEGWGVQTTGVWVDKEMWVTGYDFMGVSLFGTTDDAWIMFEHPDQESGCIDNPNTKLPESSRCTYRFLYDNIQSYNDPEIYLANGVIYKDGTAKMLPSKQYRLPEGTPDILMPGNYSLQFLDSSGAVIGTTNFDAEFYINIIPKEGYQFTNANFGWQKIDYAPFAFATIYPSGTTDIQLINISKPLYPLVKINASEINERLHADSGGPYKTFRGKPTILNAIDSYSPYGVITSYEWDLDNDGLFDDAIGASPTTYWSESGEFPISLKVSDSEGRLDIDSSTIIVKELVQIGYIVSNTPELGTKTTYIEEVLTPALNAYAESIDAFIEFEFLIDDANGQAAVHLEKVQGFKAMDINIFIGGGWSSQAQAALSYVNDNDMLMVSASSTSPLLAIEDDNFYRICPTDLIQAPVIAAMLDSWGIQALIVLQRADSWADGIYASLLPELADKGIPIIERIRYSGSVTDFSTYLDTLHDILIDNSDIYGTDEIGVLCLSFDELVTIVNQTSGYPFTRDFIWMGAESSGRSQTMIDNAGGLQTDLRLFSPMLASPESEKWMWYSNRYNDETTETADYYQGTDYDAAWIIALSILEAGSTDVGDVKAVLPEIARNYEGVTGFGELDDRGDRLYAYMEIWGYYEINGTDSFQKYGYYDSELDRVNWYDDVLAQQGLTRPSP